LIALTLLESRLAVVQALAGLAAFLFLGTWTGDYLTSSRLYTALAFYFVFTLFHTAAPLSLHRLRKIKIPWWSNVVPALALLLVLMPILQLSEISIVVWPFLLIVNLLAIILALAAASLLPILAVLLLTVVALSAWLVWGPAELIGLPTGLWLLGAFAVFFQITASWASRRLTSPGNACAEAFRQH
jgi:hypothetical protein